MKNKLNIIKILLTFLMVFNSSVGVKAATDNNGIEPAAAIYVCSEGSSNISLVQEKVLVYIRLLAFGLFQEDLSQ